MASLIADAARALAQGHLVAFPTETVYGLGADGLNPAAVARIFEVKGRPADHPVILHVADIARAKALALDWPDAADRLAQRFWPGPLTLILKRAAQVPDSVTGGQDTVGIRMPSHPMALGLLQAFAAVGSGVIAAPSANRFGGVSPTRAADVIADLGERLSQQDMVIDGGACDVGVESTIVDVSSGAVRVLRPGGVSRADIEQCLGLNTINTISTDADSEPKASCATNGRKADVAIPRVSGSLASHYAPRARVMLADSADMQARALQYLDQHRGQKLACLTRTAAISSVQPPTDRLAVVQMPHDAPGYAQCLYAQLHDLDNQGFDALLIELPPEEDAWEAVRDRLQRAAA